MVAIGRGGVVIGELNDEEWEVVVLRLVPVVTPRVDHGCEQSGVCLVSPSVGFALVPDGAFDGEWDDGLDHAVVEAGD